MRRMTPRLRQRRPPHGHLVRRKLPDRLMAEALADRVQVVAQPRHRRRSRLVLLQVRVRQLAQRHPRSKERPEAYAPQRLLECRARLTARPKTIALPPLAARLVIADGPRSGRRTKHLSALRAHAAESSASVSWFSQSHAASTSLHRNRTGRTVPGIRRPGIRPSRY